MEMSTLNTPRRAPERPLPGPARRPRPRRRFDRTRAALALVLLGALGLRLWGIRSGLPFSYNADEEGHFVPIAIGFFGHDANPGYFLNPPGYTELLATVYAIWFGGRDALAHAYTADPSEVFLVARVTAALAGTVAVWLLHLVGARLFDRRVGLLAAALGAVAFLPVFYGHFALNDAPALAPATLALLGAALVLRGGGPSAVLLGGAAAGLAAGTKYTAGIALVPLLSAILAQEHARHGGRVELRPALRRCGLALAAALAGFLVANPYALLDYGAFHTGVTTQQELSSGDELSKLGLTQGNGIVYYLWTLTWGLGWVPALAALGGALRLLARDRRLALVLLPAPLLFVAIMASAERYFGRWLLPAFPIAILLAASFGVAVVRAVARRAPGLALPAAFAVALALLGQGLVTSIHTDRVLARPDTRGTLRTWMLAHVPAGARVVLEPIVPVRWLQDPNRRDPATARGGRWRLWNTSRADVDDAGRPLPHGQTRYVKLDKYERTLRPQLIDEYRAAGYCWVVVGSTQFSRAFAQPREVPQAIAYYDALARNGRELLRIKPYAGARTPAFNFDWSFDSYPLAYVRPGPELLVYRLRGTRCG
jgi:hypothetical protein